jgi:hypothetical protein
MAIRKQSSVLSNSSSLVAKCLPTFRPGPKPLGGRKMAYWKLASLGGPPQSGISPEAKQGRRCQRSTAVSPDSNTSVSSLVNLSRSR